MAKRITVVGSSNVDFITQVEHLPAVGETVTNGVFMQAFGGKGANQAVTAARAGGQVTFLACVGADAFGQQMIANFQADGIETDRIAQAQGIATGSALIVVDRNGENYIAVAPGANRALEPAHIEASADLIALSALIVMQMEVPPRTVNRVLELAAERGVPVMLNYAPVSNREVSVSPQVTYLIVNEVEVGVLTGQPVETVAQAQQAAAALRKRGPACVVVTLGADGAWISSDALDRHIPAFKVTPVDTTAAGDVFCGALAVALCEAMPLEEAVRFASGASAISVTRMGAQPSIPRREEIDSFLNRS